jgi:Bacterial regulatory protein, Fis family
MTAMLTRRALMAIFAGTSTANPSLKAVKPELQTLAAVERAHILHVLRETGRNQTLAARRLAISRRNLSYREIPDNPSVVRFLKATPLNLSGSLRQSPAPSVIKNL